MYSISVRLGNEGAFWASENVDRVGGRLDWSGRRSESVEEMLTEVFIKTRRV